jgi:hypothetical protein
LISLVRIVRFFWFFTFLVYFVVVFLCYYQWTDPLGVSFSNSGTINYVMGRSEFFYAVNAFMISYNLIFMLLNQAMEGIPTAKLKIPNKDFWTSSRYNSDYVKYLFSNWVRSLAAMMNIVYILWLIMICYANLEQYDMRKSISSFWFIAPLFFGTIIIWALFAILRLRYKTVLIHDNSSQSANRVVEHS